MEVLITGAAGFLGSHLAAHYLRHGHKVCGIDDFSTSLGPDSPHVKALEIEKRFTLIKRDITTIDPDEFDPAKRRFDLICNFACPASPPRYQAMPVHTMMTCVVGTKNVLEIAAAHGSKVVHASTSEVYGDPDVSPQYEGYWGRVNSYGPRSCYDEGKRAAEALCYDFRKDVDIRMVRIFNTYGPNMDPDDGRVVSNFIVQALRKVPLTVYGSGTQTRSFCYVDDLVRGIVSLGALNYNPASPVNIGNPSEFTISELAHAVVEKLGGDVRYMPLPVDDPQRRRPDTSLAQRILGWRPHVSLNDGLDRTIEYFKGLV